MMKSSRSFVAATALLWCAIGGAHAADVTESEAIVVTGQTPERLNQFVDQLAAVSPMADQLPRWDNRICTSVAGLPRRQAEFFADRIAQRGAMLGLQPGEPGCQANVSIFFSAESDVLARRMFEADRSMFAYFHETNVATLGQGAFNSTFLNSDAPVRWWHVAQTVGADGIALSGDASQGGLSNAPVQRSTGTRMRNETRQDLSRVIIVVDASRVGSAPLAAIADYVSMVALAQIDPAGDTSGFPTILNLFDQNGQQPASLTEWDLAFLDGLYRSTRYAPNARQQKREIARRMNGAAS